MSILNNARTSRFRTTHFFASTAVAVALGFLGMVGGPSVQPLFDIDFGNDQPAPSAPVDDSVASAGPQPEEPADEVSGAPQSALGLALAERFGDRVEFFNSAGKRIQEPSKGDSVVRVHDPDAPQASGELTMVEADGKPVWVVIDTDDPVTGLMAHILRTEHEPVWPLPEASADAGLPENTLGIALARELGDVKFIRTRTPETSIRMDDGTPLSFDPRLPGAEAFTASPAPGDRVTGPYLPGLAEGQLLSLEVDGALVWLEVQMNAEIDGFLARIKA